MDDHEEMNRDRVLHRVGEVVAGLDTGSRLVRVEDTLQDEGCVTIEISKTSDGYEGERLWRVGVVLDSSFEDGWTLEDVLRGLCERIQHSDQPSTLNVVVGDGL